MNNAEKFKQIFGLYATELWSMPEGDFLAWLNRAAETAQPEHKRGEWILQSDDHHEYYECDLCGICVGLFDVRNFCCNCGADMRKERKG